MNHHITGGLYCICGLANCLRSFCLFLRKEIFCYEKACSDDNYRCKGEKHILYGDLMKIITTVVLYFLTNNSGPEFKDSGPFSEMTSVSDVSGSIPIVIDINLLCGFRFGKR